MSADQAFKGKSEAGTGSLAAMCVDKGTTAVWENVAATCP